MKTSCFVFRVSCLVKKTHLLACAGLLLLGAGSAPAQQSFSALRIKPDDAGAAGVLELCDPANWLTAPNSTTCHGLRAGAITTPTIWTLPPADGTNTQVMQTNGSGALSWADNGSGGGTPGGVSRDVQLNISGAFGVVTAPNRIFEVGGTDTNLRVLNERSAAFASSTLSAFSYTGSNANSGGKFLGMAARGTVAVPTAVQTGDALSVFVGGGYNGSAFVQSGIAQFVTTGNWSGSSHPTEFRISTTPSGGTSPVKQWIVQDDGDLVPSTDGQNRIGANTNRILEVFTDTLNGEILEIPNATHTVLRQILLAGSNDITFKKTGGATAFVIRNTGAIEFHGSQVMSTDSTHDIGSNTVRARDGYADSWRAETFRIDDAAHALAWTISQQTADTSRINFNDGTRDLLELNRQITTADFVFGNSSGTFAPHLLPYGDNIGQLGKTGRRWSQAFITSITSGASFSQGRLFVYPSSGSFRTFSADANGFTINGDLTPTNDHFYQLGQEGTLFNHVWITTIHAGNPGSTGTRRQGVASFANTDVTATAVASFVGVVANGGTAAEHAAIQVDNLQVSASGNFYHRPISGDATCTNVGDGWFAVQTTDEELQVCIGGNLRVVALVAP